MKNHQLNYLAKENLRHKGHFGMSFADAKAAGKLVFGQLPVLDADGVLIAQSGSQGGNSINILWMSQNLTCP